MTSVSASSLSRANATLRRSRSDIASSNPDAIKLIKDGYTLITRKAEFITAYQSKTKLASVGAYSRESIQVRIADEDFRKKIEAQCSAKFLAAIKKTADIRELCVKVADEVKRILPNQFNAKKMQENKEAKFSGIIPLFAFGDKPYQGGFCRHAALYAACLLTWFLSERDAKAGCYKVNIYRATVLVGNSNQGHAVCTLMVDDEAKADRACYVVDPWFGGDEHKAAVFDLINYKEKKQAEAFYHYIPAFLDGKFNELMFRRQANLVVSTCRFNFSPQSCSASINSVAIASATGSKQEKKTATMEDADGMAEEATPNLNDQCGDDTTISVSQQQQQNYL